MKKIALFGISILLLQGCATSIDRTPDLHSTGKLNAVVACLDKEDAAKISRYAHADRSKAGQAIKVNYYVKQGKCALISKGTYQSSNEDHVFYMDEETIQRRWSPKKYVTKIYKDDTAYWLIPSKNN